MAKIKVAVSSRHKGGHRRAGYKWPDNPVTLELEEALVAQLKKDPHLVVLDPNAPIKTIAPVGKVNQAGATQAAEGDGQLNEQFQQLLDNQERLQQQVAELTSSQANLELKAQEAFEGMQSELRSRLDAFISEGRAALDQVRAALPAAPASAPAVQQAPASAEQPKTDAPTQPAPVAPAGPPAAPAKGKNGQK